MYKRQVYLRASHLVADAYSFYEAIGLWSRLYAAPEDAWPELLESVTRHPGDLSMPAPSEQAVQRYATRLRAMTSATHDVLTPRRNQGRILGTSTQVRIGGAQAARLRDSWAMQRNGAATLFFAAYAAVLQQLSLIHI